MLINKTKGFTIIEVLVSMVILSIGVLSLGVLQLSAMQNTQGGYLRSQATILTYDIIDSMRANIPAVTGDDYRITWDQLVRAIHRLDQRAATGVQGAKAGFEQTYALDPVVTNDFNRLAVEQELDALLHA